MRYKGTVLQGRKVAQKLGFPTLNIDMEDKATSGIFAAKVYVDGKEFPAAAYADASRNIVEAHMLDENLDFYGKAIEIELLKKIRDDKQFPDEASLKAAIAQDVEATREFFNQ